MHFMQIYFKITNEDIFNHKKSFLSQVRVATQDPEYNIVEPYTRRIPMRKLNK